MRAIVFFGNVKKKKKKCTISIIIFRPPVSFRTPDDVWRLFTPRVSPRYSRFSSDVFPHRYSLPHVLAASPAFTDRRTGEAFKKADLCAAAAAAAARDDGLSGFAGEVEIFRISDGARLRCTVVLSTGRRRVSGRVCDCDLRLDETVRPRVPRHGFSYSGERQIADNGRPTSNV